MNENLCVHDFSFGYCPHQCIKFANLKEKIAADKNKLCEDFNQKPLTREKLLARKRFPKMSPETRATFTRKMILYHSMERRFKY